MITKDNTTRPPMTFPRLATAQAEAKAIKLHIEGLSARHNESEALARGLEDAITEVNDLNAVMNGLMVDNAVDGGGIAGIRKLRGELIGARERVAESEAAITASAALRVEMRAAQQQEAVLMAGGRNALAMDIAEYCNGVLSERYIAFCAEINEMESIFFSAGYMLSEVDADSRPPLNGKPRVPPVGTSVGRKFLIDAIAQGGLERAVIGLPEGKLQV